MRMFTLPVIPQPVKPTSLATDDITRKIETLLDSRGQNLQQAILERDLYFRMSLVGDCNLSCAFCHNEGSPLGGSANLDYSLEVMKAAAAVGFYRIQFTGGEPLLHPEVVQFVSQARTVFDDVGITTNGTYLRKHLSELIKEGLTRMHISLQVPVLEASGQGREWGIPHWLEPSLVLASRHSVSTRLNLPVPRESLSEAAAFLRLIASYHCDLKVFAILPEGQCHDEEYPIQELIELVDNENRLRQIADLSTRVFLRGYIAPAGVRCSNCEAFSRCKEQSHSLRFGADNVLRPCLATRQWDLRVSEIESLEGQIRLAALLALDYRW